MLTPSLHANVLMLGWHKTTIFQLMHLPMWCYATGCPSISALILMKKKKLVDNYLNKEILTNI